MCKCCPKPSASCSMQQADCQSGMENIAIFSKISKISDIFDIFDIFDIYRIFSIFSFYSIGLGDVN